MKFGTKMPVVKSGDHWAGPGANDFTTKAQSHKDAQRTKSSFIVSLFLCGLVAVASQDNFRIKRTEPQRHRVTEGAALGQSGGAG